MDSDGFAGWHLYYLCTTTHIITIDIHTIGYLPTITDKTNIAPYNTSTRCHNIKITIINRFYLLMTRYINFRVSILL